MTERIIPYAGQDVRVLADLSGGQGFAMVRMEVPAGFGGPPPHLHNDFDEAIYVLEGELVILDGNEENAIGAGRLAVAPRGRRHSFRNPSQHHVQVLGIWTPASALSFLEEAAQSCQSRDHQTVRPWPRCTAAHFVRRYRRP